MAETAANSLRVDADLTAIEGRKAAGLPEIVPINWLSLNPARAEQLRSIVDVDFTSSTGMRVGRSVSPWPLICAPLAMVEAEHNRHLRQVTELRSSVDKVKDMPNLYAEVIEALDKAEKDLLQASQRLPVTHERAQRAMTIVAEHLYDAGFIARPGVRVQPEGPELGV